MEKIDETNFHEFEDIELLKDEIQNCQDSDDIADINRRLRNAQIRIVRLIYANISLEARVKKLEATQYF